MADYFVQFSEIVPCASKEQQEWFLRELAEGVKDGTTYPPCEFSADGKDVWVYSEDSGDIGALAGIVATFQERFGIEEPWSLSWAGTCSNPRVGDFGGGGIVVYKGKATSWNTWDWCTSEMRRLQERTGRGGKRVMSSAERSLDSLRAFIEKHQAKDSEEATRLYPSTPVIREMAQALRCFARVLSVLSIQDTELNAVDAAGDLTRILAVTLYLIGYRTSKEERAVCKP